VVGAKHDQKNANIALRFLENFPAKGEFMSLVDKALIAALGIAEFRLALMADAPNRKRDGSAARPGHKKSNSFPQLKHDVMEKAVRGGIRAAKTRYSDGQLQARAAAEEIVSKLSEFDLEPSLLHAIHQWTDRCDDTLLVNWMTHVLLDPLQPIEGKEPSLASGAEAASPTPAPPLSPTSATLKAAMEAETDPVKHAVLKATYDGRTRQKTDAKRLRELEIQIRDLQIDNANLRAWMAENEEKKLREGALG
jgi:hypothetical protein